MRVICNRFDFFIPRVQQFSDFHNHDLNKLAGFGLVFPRGLRSYKERVENSLNLVSLKFSLVRKIQVPSLIIFYMSQQ